MDLGKTALTLILIIFENVLELFPKPHSFTKTPKTYCFIFILFFAAASGVWKKKFKNIFPSFRIRLFIGISSKGVISERDFVIKKDWRNLFT